MKNLVTYLILTIITISTYSQAQLDSITYYRVTDNGISANKKYNRYYFYEYDEHKITSLTKCYEYTPPSGPTVEECRKNTFEYNINNQLISKENWISDIPLNSKNNHSFTRWSYKTEYSYTSFDKVDYYKSFLWTNVWGTTDMIYEPSDSVKYNYDDQNRLVGTKGNTLYQYENNLLIIDRSHFSPLYNNYENDKLVFSTNKEDIEKTSFEFLYNENGSLKGIIETDSIVYDERYKTEYFKNDIGGVTVTIYNYLSASDSWLPSGKEEYYFHLNTLDELHAPIPLKKHKFEDSNQSNPFRLFDFEKYHPTYKSLLTDHKLIDYKETYGFKDGEYFIYSVINYHYSDLELRNEAQTSLGNKQEESISFYPNPASNTLYISKTPPHKEYIIHSVIGTTLQSGPLLGQKIDISALPIGTYYLTIGANSTKFIKQ